MHRKYVKIIKIELPIKFAQHDNSRTLSLMKRIDQMEYLSHLDRLWLAVARYHCIKINYRRAINHIFIYVPVDDE